MARIVSLTVLTTLIVVLGLVFYQIVSPFLLPLFIAGVLAILCQPLYQRLVQESGGRVRLSAAITTLAVLVVILVPLLLGTILAAQQLYALANQQILTRDWDATLSENNPRLVSLMRWYYGDELTDEELKPHIDEFRDNAIERTRSVLRSIGERSLGIAGRTLDVLGTLAFAVVGLMMFAIALYYFLSDGPQLLNAAQGLIPVHIDYQRELVSRFDTVVRAVVLATFLSAIAQGLATATLLYSFGAGHFFIFFIIATITSLIPLVGAWSVWAPYAVWLAVQGHWGQAAAMTAIGGLVIGTMDNVIKTYVLQSDAKLHPLLAFISVLGGLQAMGLWGIFIGPIAASCLHALVKIFNIELKALSRARFASGIGQARESEPEDDALDAPSGSSETVLIERPGQSLLGSVARMMRRLAGPVTLETETTNPPPDEKSPAVKPAAGSTPRVVKKSKPAKSRRRKRR